MKYAMISTWKMSYDGMQKAQDALRKGCDIHEAIKIAIQDVEQREEFISVGHGGLPNKKGQVQLDSAFMDGNTLGFGGVIEAENIQSPIDVAIDLAKQSYNCLLAAQGAQEYAKEKGFPFENHLTARSKKIFEDACHKGVEWKAYEGHDTVCVLGKQADRMAAGVSTSGLFMKHMGRVGDSAIIGSGFYADALCGCAAATGMGEDIMRGCLSIRIVDAMRYGIEVQKAADTILDAHLNRMKQANRDCEAISVIAMDAKGNYGASTNIEEFPFVVLQDDQLKLMVASFRDGKHMVFEADEAWILQYQGD